MSHKRRVWQEISDLAARMASGQAAPADLGDLSRQLSKLGKAQFKVAAVAESQAERWDEALSTLQKTVNTLEQRQRGAVAAARQDLLAALLPVLDGLEAALASGERHLGHARSNSQVSTPMTDGDRSALAAWLDGLRLVRERLLALLAEAEVVPIPTVGQPFDPYRHVAVGVVEDGRQPPGTIVAEQRRGYASPAGVLRYAEVIVVKEKA